VRENSSNPTKFCDGDIAWHILFYRSNEDIFNEQKWWARLRSGKAKDLKRLLKKKTFRDILNDLMLVRGLWPRFLIGPIRRYSILKCDEAGISFPGCSNANLGRNF
jgi:hypothetical protein